MESFICLRKTFLRFSPLNSEESDSAIENIELVSPINSEFCEEMLTEITLTANLQSQENILNYFCSNDVVNFLEDISKVFLIKLKVEECVTEINPIVLTEIAKKCKLNSVVIFLTTDRGNRFFLFWKSNKIQHMLIFKIYDRVEFMNDVRCFEFLTIFFVNSLRRQHIGLHNKVPINPDYNSYKLHLLADHRNYNLLLVAAEMGDICIVNFMIAGGFSTEAHDTNAQTLAWNNRHFDILYELLISNHRFPESINIEECPDNIKSFYQVSQDLHSAMIFRDIAKIEQILSENPKLIHFYNLENESVLSFALRNKLFDVYSLLLSKNSIKFGPHETFSKIKDSLSSNDKKKLREIHYNQSKLLPDNHMHLLLLNSRLGHNTTEMEKKFEIIQKAFEILNENPFIQVILMIVAASRNFRIIFDFNYDSIEIIDPTAKKTARGVFYSTGRIYIGAKRLLIEQTKFEALGTLAHELCHYAVNVVYKNYARPYKSGDEKSKQDFEEILEYCKENCGKEEIIDLVHQNYPNHLHHAELIVRPPHLIMLYFNNEEKLEEIRNIFIKLFEKFENKIIPEMKKALPSVEAKADCEVQTKNKKIRKLKLISIIGGMLAIIITIFGFFVARSIFYKPTYKFASLSLEDQQKIATAPIDFKNVRLNFRDLFSNTSKAYEKLSSDHISQMLDRNKPLNLNGSDAFYLNGFIYLNWRNLTEKLKPIILDSNFSFQNETIKFKNMKSSVLASLTSSQLIDILDNKTLTVALRMKTGPKIYIERNLFYESIYEIYFYYINQNADKKSKSCNLVQSKTTETFVDFYYKFLNQSISEQITKIIRIRHDFNFKYCKNHIFNNYDQTDTKIIDNLGDHSLGQISFNEIFKVANKTKIFVLSAEAGAGKTITFQELEVRIKKAYPTLWVSYIELRNLKDLYKKVETLDDVKKLFARISSLEHKNEFEKAIFHESFNSGNLVLLWNGFHDIDPENNVEILDIFKIIQLGTRNVQFISTRPNYSNDFMKEFNTKCYTFISFSTEEQEKFLKKFFISQNLYNETVVATYLQKVQRIENSAKLNDESRTPLLLRMIAELILKDKEIFETENVYEIYEKFVDTKINDFTIKNISILNGIGFKEIYQQNAIKIKPDRFSLSINSKKLEIMKLTASKELNDEISKMQILDIIGSKKIEFTHETFINFFFAQYLIDNIYTLSIYENISTQELDYRLRVFCGAFEDHPGIANFVASFLQTKIAKSSKEFHPEISKLFRTKFKKILNYFLTNGRFEVFSILIDFFHKDHQLLIDLLQINQNKTFYTELYNFANLEVNYSFDEDVDFDKIKAIVKTYLNESEYEKFLRGKNQKGILLYSMYCFSITDDEFMKGLYINEEFKLDRKLLRNKHPNYVFTEIAKNLTNEELKELLMSKTILYIISTSRNNIEIFDQKMWIRIEEVLKIDEQKQWLEDILQIISFYPNTEFTKRFFLKIETIFSNSEIVQIFKKSQILQIAASDNVDQFNYLWHFYFNHSTEIEQISILKQQVEIECTGDFKPYGNCYFFPFLNILQSSFLDKDFTRITDIRNIYKTYFNSTEIRKLITSSDNFLPFFFKLQPLKKCNSLLKLLNEYFEEDKNSLYIFYKNANNYLPILINYGFYEEKNEIIKVAIDSLIT